MIENITEWLNEEPPAEFVKVLDSKKKKGVDKDRVVRYIPIEHIKEMLNELTEGKWSTTSFTHTVSPFKDRFNRNDILITGSVELNIPTFTKDVMYQPRPRILTGASNVIASFAGNNVHYLATALSLATTNAAQNLGRRFGLYLNEEPPPAIEQISEEKAAEEEDDVINSFIGCDSVEKLKTWEPESAISKRTKSEYDLKMISLLLAERSSQLDDGTKDGIERIIAGREVLSYPKALKILNKL